MDEIYEQLCWAHVCMEHGWRLSLWYITRGFYLSLLERVFHVKFCLSYCDFLSWLLPIAFTPKSTSDVIAAASAIVMRHVYAGSMAGA
jgi:hypothetical protein